MKRIIAAITAALLTFSAVPVMTFTANAAGVPSGSVSVSLTANRLLGDGFGYYTHLSTGVDVNSLPYVRITYKSDQTAAHELILCAGGKELVLEDDISKSGGKTVRSEAVFVPKSFRDAITSGDDVAVRCTATADGCEVEITEVRFFESDDKAYSFYNEVRTEPYVPNSVSFGSGGNYAFYGTGYDNQNGSFSYDSKTDALVIKYLQNKGYLTMVRLADTSKWRDDDCYVRIVYEANTTSQNVNIRLQNNANGQKISLGTAKPGKGWKLSDAVKLPDGHIERYKTYLHNTLAFDDAATDSSYLVKAILFFPTLEAANAYKLTEEKQVDVSIMGEHISKYRIVIPSAAHVSAQNAAKLLSDTIYEKCGVRLATVRDNVAKSDYEIILGNCDRPELDDVPLDYSTAYAVRMVGKKPVFKENSGADLISAVELFCRVYAEAGKSSDGNVNIGSDVELTGRSDIVLTDLDIEAANEPLKVNYSFDSAADVDKFNAVGGTVMYNKGAMRISGGKPTVAESPLYDSDMSLDFAFSYREAADGARVGAMLRRSGDDTYVSVCYDAEAEKLSVNLKPSMTTAETVLAERELSLLPGHLYRMGIELVGERLTVTLWGERLLEADGVIMNAPGKAAFFADGATMEVCELDAVLYTVLGRELGDALFKQDVIMERGGDSNYRIPSMICTNSGTVIAVANDRRYSVADGAPEQWLVLRRKPAGGEWEEIKVIAATENKSHAIGNAIYDDVNDVIILLYSNATPSGGAAFSYDDGVTWEVKDIKKVPNSYGKNGGTHGGSAGFVLKYGEHAGRIIAPARFATVSNETAETLKTVAYNCAIYSDDGGITWHTSEPVQPGTGEGTLIEREDGVIVYNSRAYFYDHYRRVAYSYDGGETFTDFRIDTELLEPNFGVNASMWHAKMKNGQVITLFSNPYPDASMIGSQARRNMTVSLSYNEAGSWVTKKTVNAGFSAYSCLTYNPVTDTFFLMYEGGDTNSDDYGHIAVLEFNLEWLLEG